MGAANDDLSADKKRRQDAEQEQQRANEKKYLQSAGDRQFEAGFAEVRAMKAADEEYDKAGQAAKDLKTKRASEGKIRY